MQKTRRAYKSCRYVSCVTWRVCSLPLHCTLDTKYMLCSILSMNVITTMMPIDFASHSSPLVNLSDFFLISIRPKAEIFDLHGICKFWPRVLCLKLRTVGSWVSEANCGVLTFGAPTNWTWQQLRRWWFGRWVAWQWERWWDQKIDATSRKIRENVVYQT